MGWKTISGIFANDLKKNSPIRSVEVVAPGLALGLSLMFNFNQR